MFLLMLAAGIAATVYLSPLKNPVFILICLWFLVFAQGLRQSPTAYRVYLGLVIGIVIGALHAILIASTLLPESLEQSPLTLDVEVIDLPVVTVRKTRFVARVLAANADTFVKKIQLNWYNSPEIAPGQRWRLTVKLRRPRGMVNEAGFDYQAWLHRQGIGATGYVLEYETRFDKQQTSPSLSAVVDVRRFHLQQRILASDVEYPSVILALLLGDKSTMPKALSSLFISTGTVHLMAISGLHIGLVVAIGYVCARFCMVVLCIVFCWRYQAVVPVVFSLLCGAFYAAMAGFSIPTIRALLMVAVFHFFYLCRLHVSPWLIFRVALVCVMLLFPLSVLDQGFLMSFAAVAILLLSMSGYFQTSHRLTVFFRLQLMVFLGLLVPTLLVGGSAPLLSMLANAVAIPWVSIVIVPLLFLGALLLSVFDHGGYFLLFMVDAAIDCLVWYLSVLSQFQWQLWAPEAGISNAAVLFLALLGCLLLLLRGVPGYWVGAFLFLPLLFSNHKDSQALVIRVFDVGQGLSVLIEHRGHYWLYDTGPAFSEHFNAGSGVVLPFLRYSGVSHIDGVIVSHGDLDHAGGVQDILSHMPVDTVFLPAAERQLTHRLTDTSGAGRSAFSIEFCHQQAPVIVGQLQLEFLPVPVGLQTSRNNYSCVLLLTFNGMKVLLPGDIDRDVEFYLLSQFAAIENLDLLVVPHHGSGTSSSLEFLRRTRPKVAIISAGYKNRYGHPKDEVLERYQSLDSKTLNTAYSGMITITLTADGKITTQSLRNTRGYYWYQF